MGKCMFGRLYKSQYGQYGDATRNFEGIRDKHREQLLGSSLYRKAAVSEATPQAKAKQKDLNAPNSPNSKLKG